MISSKALDGSGSWPIGHASAVLCWAVRGLLIILFAADRFQKKNSCYRS